MQSLIKYTFPNYHRPDSHGKHGESIYSRVQCHTRLSLANVLFIESSSIKMISPNIDKWLVGWSWFWFPKAWLLICLKINNHGCLARCRAFINLYVMMCRTHTQPHFIYGWHPSWQEASAMLTWLVLCDAMEGDRRHIRRFIWPNEYSSVKHQHLHLLPLSRADSSIAPFTIRPAASPFNWLGRQWQSESDRCARVMQLCATAVWNWEVFGLETKKSISIYIHFRCNKYISMKYQ